MSPQHHLISREVTFRLEGKVLHLIFDRAPDKQVTLEEDTADQLSAYTDGGSEMFGRPIDREQVKFYISDDKRFRIELPGKEEGPIGGYVPGGIGAELQRHTVGKQLSNHGFSERHRENIKGNTE